MTAMTDAELEKIYKTESAHSHEAALRAIYSLGLAGAGVPRLPPTGKPLPVSEPRHTPFQQGD